MKIHNLTVYCNNIAETTRFYNELLEFDIIKEYQPVPDVKLAIIERDGMKIELLERVGAPKVYFSDFTTTLGFSTNNINEEYKMFKEKGIKIKSELRSIGPKTRIFEVFDPNGFPIYVIQED
jgi:catechol 2,3-dioxygenase-like lactoylglutathione lyase family enzyme